MQRVKAGTPGWKTPALACQSIGRESFPHIMQLQGPQPKTPTLSSSSAQGDASAAGGSQIDTWTKGTSTSQALSLHPRTEACEAELSSQGSVWDHTMLSPMYLLQLT